LISVAISWTERSNVKRLSPGKVTQQIQSLVITLFYVKLQRIVVTSHFRTAAGNCVVPLEFFHCPTVAGEKGATRIVVTRSRRRQIDVNVVPQVAANVSYVCDGGSYLKWEGMLQGYVVSVVVTMRIGSGPNEVFTTARGTLK